LVDEGHREAAPGKWLNRGRLPDADCRRSERFAALAIAGASPVTSGDGFLLSNEAAEDPNLGFFGVTTTETAAGSNAEPTSLVRG
jgi:hypothetical protein